MSAAVWVLTKGISMNRQVQADKRAANERYQLQISERHDRIIEDVFADSFSFAQTAGLTGSK